MGPHTGRAEVNKKCFLKGMSQSGLLSKTSRKDEEKTAILEPFPSGKGGADS